MNQYQTGGAFADVDQAAAPDACVEFLDTVSGLNAARQYTRITFARLSLSAGHHVLDVGCGTGEDVQALAALVAPGGHAVGIDSSQTMIEQAGRRTAETSAATNEPLSIEYRVADAYSLPFAAQSFDRCRADRVLIHLGDPDRALSEMVRVLKPDGRLVVFEPDWDTLVFDAPDKATSRRVSRAIAGDNRNGWIGSLTGFTVAGRVP